MTVSAASYSDPSSKKTRPDSIRRITLLVLSRQFACCFAIEPNAWCTLSHRSGRVADDFGVVPLSVLS